MYNVFSARFIKLESSVPWSFWRLFQNCSCLFRTSAVTDGCLVSRNIKAVGVLDRTSSAILNPLLYNDNTFLGSQCPHISQLLRIVLQKHAWKTSSRTYIVSVLWLLMKFRNLTITFDSLSARSHFMDISNELSSVM